MVQIVLRIQHVNHTFINRLYDYNAAVKVGFFIHVVNDPVNKRTKEVTFAKLNDAFGTLHFHGCFFV
ncbi:hypothetical protein SDC9_114676 [bioreactor metagenome]|uniref:Uncharacterized protein n=1 Tax=bioreactor metagenome TaxID=1076179 RepID=A0A645BRC7_9ZZZZ